MAIDLSDYEAGKKYDGDYSDDLEALQERLARALVAFIVHKKSALIVFEGWDASGKGGAIQRLTAKWDPRAFQVWPIRAPTEEEKARHFLWRFWTKLPAAGEIALFDRSWYGRVLVERVEGFCSEADWMRAYHEINDFEEQLTEAGALIVKFWLAVTPAEQLRRFKQRQEIAYKRFKITDEDWRNRKKWPAYERAVEDMLSRTSSDLAPWHVVASNDKLFSRIEVLERLVERLEKA